MKFEEILGKLENESEELNCTVVNLAEKTEVPNEYDDKDIEIKVRPFNILNEALDLIANLLNLTVKENDMTNKIITLASEDDKNIYIRMDASDIENIFSLLFVNSKDKDKEAIKTQVDLLIDKYGECTENIIGSFGVDLVLMLFELKKFEYNNENKEFLVELGNILSDFISKLTHLLESNNVSLTEFCNKLEPTRYAKYLHIFQNLIGNVYQIGERLATILEKIHSEGMIELVRHSAVTAIRKYNSPIINSKTKIVMNQNPISSSDNIEENFNYCVVPYVEVETKEDLEKVKELFTLRDKFLTTIPVSSEGHKIIAHLIPMVVLGKNEELGIRNYRVVFGISHPKYNKFINSNLETKDDAKVMYSLVNGIGILCAVLSNEVNKSCNMHLDKFTEDGLKNEDEISKLLAQTTPHGFQEPFNPYGTNRDEYVREMLMKVLGQTLAKTGFIHEENIDKMFDTLKATTQLHIEVKNKIKENR